jgi:hypothetical protein
VQSVAENRFDRSVSWLQLGNAYERVGSLLKYNLIPQEPFLDVYWGRTIHAWEVMQPVISLVRKLRGPSIYENFEYMYVQSKAFEARHSNGNYPKRVPHADVPSFDFPSALGEKEEHVS